MTLKNICGVKEDVNYLLDYLHYEAGTLLYYSDIPGLNEYVNKFLDYLHYEAGTLLYYSDIPGLNEYVITDFQLIFDSISYGVSYATGYILWTLLPTFSQCPEL